MKTAKKESFFFIWELNISSHLCVQKKGFWHSLVAVSIGVEGSAFGFVCEFGD